jgi:transcriptional regulator with XRE-family HTH domain
MHSAKRPKRVTSWHVIGAQLAVFRNAARMTQAGLAERLCVGEETIASIEQGRRPLKLDLAEVIDELLETERALQTAVAKVPERERFPAFAQDFVGHEQEALTLLWYESQVVPGLLQTEEYAQAMIHAARPDISVTEVEKRVRVRMGRQSLVTQDDPIDLWVVLDEAVLRRPVGGRAVMRRQLEHLSLAAGWPNVTLQVLPFSAGAHAGMDGTFTMLLYDESAGQNFVFASNAAGGLFLEKDDELQRYGFIFDYLRANALRPDESVSMIVKLTKEL